MWSFTNVKPLFTQAKTDTIYRKDSRSLQLRVLTSFSVMDIKFLQLKPTLDLSHRGQMGKEISIKGEFPENLLIL